MAARLVMAFLAINLMLGSSVVFGVASAGKYKKNYTRPSKVPHPDSNPYSKAKEELGRALFFDPRLSGSDWISCATCHNPAFAWEDGLPKGIGHGMKAVGRSTPTVLNLAWGELMFWDGRAEDLEEQALGPIAAAGEMNLPHDKLIKKLKAVKGYHPMFAAAFPKDKKVSKENVGKAIATFERTIVSGKAPFDRWIDGDERAISASAKRGFVVFNDKGKCAECHSGWRFTDDGFHDIGIKGADKGRGAIIEGVDSLQHAFKTPTLRNIVERAPYMHDGSEATLEAVVDLYNKGGRVRRKSVSENVVKLNLSRQEQGDLVAFLKTLTSKDKPVAAPLLPR